MEIELSDAELRFVQDCIAAALNEGLPGQGNFDGQDYGNLTGGKEVSAMLDKFGMQERTWLYMNETEE